MKPSPEQVRDWRKQASETTNKAVFTSAPQSEWHDFFNLKFAELAAAWGAEQAQQTTEPLGFQIRRAIAAEDELRATKQTLEHAYAALQKVADAQAAIEEPELPEAVLCVSSKELVRMREADMPIKAWMPPTTSFEDTPLYTAAQMHDHYQAGVRAGMAQSQAPQDGLPMVVSGAIFDFAGFLTTRPNMIEVGSTANASPMADLVKEWAALRGLSLDDAAVLSWQEGLRSAMQGGQQP